MLHRQVTHVRLAHHSRSPAYTSHFTAPRRPVHERCISSRLYPLADTVLLLHHSTITSIARYTFKMTVSIDITPMDTDDTVPSPVKSDFDNSSDSGRSEALFSSANSDSTLPSEPPSPTKSTKSQTLFTDTFECLPSTGFEKQAHIIDVDALTKHAEHEGTLQLQDAVATTLYLASPETLRSFLSPTTHTFKVLFKGDRGDKQLVIWRKGVEVFVGTPSSNPTHTLIPADRYIHASHYYEVLWL